MPFLLDLGPLASTEPLPTVEPARPALDHDDQCPDAQLSRVRAPPAAFADEHRAGDDDLGELLAAICVDPVERAVDPADELEGARSDELSAVCGVGASAVRAGAVAGHPAMEDAAAHGAVGGEGGLG